MKSPLQEPSSLTGQPPKPLPPDIAWVSDLLQFLRGATKRLHPHILFEEDDKLFHLKFFHIVAFTAIEKKLIKDMVMGFAAEQGRRVSRVLINKEWVCFDVHKS